MMDCRSRLPNGRLRSDLLKLPRGTKFVRTRDISRLVARAMWPDRVWIRRGAELDIEPIVDRGVEIGLLPPHRCGLRRLRAFLLEFNGMKVQVVGATR